MNLKEEPKTTDEVKGYEEIRRHLERRIKRMKSY